ncbi:MAG: type I-G CRISPR-associated protein Csb2 [Mycobacteriales bacterium]|nr:MAG: type I-U CRISPR-associated protein Cas5/Cas6 [Pseudonocardiales bacterium]
MLAVEIRFLTDRYIATHFNDRSRPEWPPHPARLFSAMVAAWAGDEDPPGASREALTWFAALGAPQITCSAAEPRADVTHYVPVNDAVVVRDLSGTYRKLHESKQALAAGLAAAGGDLDDRDVRRARQAVDAAERKAVIDTGKAAVPGGTAEGLRVLPGERGRQGRSYPCVVPESDTVLFCWPEVIAPRDHWQRLDDVLASVSRLGHSSSMVACRLVNDCPEPTLVPDAEGADANLRVTAIGLLDNLERAHDHHQGREPRALPTRMARYRQSATAVSPLPPRPVLSGDWIVLVPTETSRLPGHRSLRVARAVRDALVHHADQPVAEILSGHQAGLAGQATAPSTEAHLAVLPLPFVGTHGDGTIMGIALLLPVGAPQGERRAVLRAVGAWETQRFELRIGRLGAPTLRRAELTEPGKTIARSRWDRPARTWVSVTPMALDRHPGELWSARPALRERATVEAVESVRLACRRVGLPEPADVVFSRDGLVRGVDPIRRFEPFAARSGPRRFLTHVGLTFDEAIGGPVVLGAGRFYGYGLFLPRRDHD